MRLGRTGDEAFAQGDGLPADVRQYTAGAMDFHAADNAKAVTRFEAVLALPAAQRHLRAVWAAFMLGRTEELLGDADKAAQAFQLSRALAVHGAADPLGLSVASYGEEAKVHFDRANAVLVGQPAAPAGSNAIGTAPPDPTFPGYTLPPRGVDTFKREMHAAAVLYAEQAARESNSGTQSLRIIAEDLVAAPERIDVAVTDPILQRLLVVYALSWLNDDMSAVKLPDDSLGLRPDAGVRVPGAVANPLLPTLIAAIAKSGIAHPAFADRIAALAYRSGRYDLAAKMTAMSNSPLSQWVQAKLALQKGDLAGAAAHYAARCEGISRDGHFDIRLRRKRDAAPRRKRNAGAWRAAITSMRSTSSIPGPIPIQAMSPTSPSAC